MSATSPAMRGVACVAATALERFGRIDSWVANAGGVDQSDSGTVMKVAADAWDRIIDLILTWAFLGAQAAPRGMHRAVRSSISAAEADPIQARSPASMAPRRQGWTH